MGDVPLGDAIGNHVQLSSKFFKRSASTAMTLARPEWIFRPRAVVGGTFTVTGHVSRGPRGHSDTSWPQIPYELLISANNASSWRQTP